MQLTICITFIKHLFLIRILLARRRGAPNDYLELPGFVRTAPSSAMKIAARLAGSVALAFSLTK